MEKTGQDFAHIITAAAKVDTLISEIVTSSRQQSEGIQQMHHNIADVDKVTQANAETAEESASSAQELNAQAETMTGHVLNLKKIVSGEE